MREFDYQGLERYLFTASHCCNQNYQLKDMIIVYKFLITINYSFAEKHFTIRHVV